MSWPNGERPGCPLSLQGTAPTAPHPLLPSGPCLNHMSHFLLERGRAQQTLCKPPGPCCGLPTLVLQLTGAGGGGHQAAGRGILASEARALQGSEDPVMTSRLPLLPPL